jgi:hypothetical protein
MAVGLAFCAIACFGSNSPMSMLDPAQAKTLVGGAGCRTGGLDSMGACKVDGKVTCPAMSTDCGFYGYSCGYDCRQSQTVPVLNQPFVYVTEENDECEDREEEFCHQGYFFFCVCGPTSDTRDCGSYSKGILAPNCGE